MTVGARCTIHRRPVELEGVRTTLPAGHGTVLQDKGNVLVVRVTRSGHVREIPRDFVTVHRSPKRA